jgi:ubiquinone/menaquinone biosynthesis C-methylase UbiE
MMQQSTTDLELELLRLNVEYQRRDSGKFFDVNRYSLFNEAARLQFQSIQHNLLAMLKRYNFTDLAEKKILDVGCGNGTHLRSFLEYGGLPTNLSGIDLIPHRIEQARCLHPAIDWQVSSAHELPYPDACFDLVMSFVVFSSILSKPLRLKIADEMWRVRKPGGLILFCDFTYSNPRNSAVQGIKREQIRELFKRPGARFDFRRLVLAPPISRTVAPRAYWLAYMLEQLKILNTHTIGIISLASEHELDGVETIVT